MKARSLLWVEDPGHKIGHNPPTQHLLTRYHLSSQREEVEEKGHTTS
jgi:hypothetical protein